MKAVVDCGFRPSYLSYGPLMDVLECGENSAIMEHLTSDVIGVNTPWDKMDSIWFKSVLSNSMPTLKLSVHCDALPANISVQQCGNKKIDELIIGFNDTRHESHILSKFTRSVLLSHCSHAPPPFGDIWFSPLPYGFPCGGKSDCFIIFFSTGVAPTTATLHVSKAVWCDQYHRGKIIHFNLPVDTLHVTTAS